MITSRTATPPVLPILKWVGGKTRLLPTLTELYGGQGHIIEPFFGGGALSFRLASTAATPLHVRANDALAPVVEIYEAVRADVEGLIGQVDKYAGPYLALSTKEGRRAYYYAVRERYMRREIDGPAPLLFMLRCAYSGMYRTGTTYPGRFNSSHGFGTEHAGFYQPDRLRAAAGLMQNWEFSSDDFAGCLPDVTADSFVLLDPPYRETYTGYTGDGFGPADHLRVVEFFKAADVRGAKVVYTNKDLGDGYYDEHFAGFHIQRVPIRYQVNRDCATVGRPETFEVVVNN